MRQCGRCRKVCRFDEDLAILQAADGTRAACPTCHAEARGEPPPEPRRYPVGQPVPSLGGSDLPICGLCRLALRENERTQPMRIVASDVEGTDTAEGCYAACSECVEKWRPLIATRLRREGIIREGTPDTAVQGDMLL